MALTLKTIPLNDAVGQGADKAPLARDLARAIVRTVSPETWLAMGGTGSVEPVFNSKDWFLVVSNDSAVVQKIEDEIVAKIKLA